ncbi:MAG: T9SS type A sorting domain-containing protein [Bacteroidota bacterium]
MKIKTFPLSSFSTALLLFIFLLTNAATTKAQIILNPGFEFLASGPTCQLSIAPVNDGCLNPPFPGGSWNAPLGISHSFDEGSCEGNRSAVFAVGRDATEGIIGSNIFYQFETDDPNNYLEPGEYTLSFCYEGELATGVPADLEIRLATGLVNDPAPDPNTLINLYYETYANQGAQLPISGISTKDVVTGLDLVNGTWLPFSTTFTLEQGENFDQLWFYGVAGGAGNGVTKICIDEVELKRCEEIEDCTEAFNLRACPQEGSTGYIDLFCGAGISYSATLPGNSTALTFNAEGHFIVTNASPGTYTIFVTDQNGCVTEKVYEVIEECCSDSTACEAPTNLRCSDILGNIFLNWDQVPGALGYNLYIYPNGGNCNTPISTNDPPILLNTNSIDVEQIPYRNFSWAVSTICPDETESALSNVVCFDVAECDTFGSSTPSTQNETQSFDQGEDYPMLLQPNPSNGKFSLVLPEFEANQTAGELFIYDQTGRLIHRQVLSTSTATIDLGYAPAGLYFINVSLDGKVTTQKLLLQ